MKVVMVTHSLSRLGGGVSLAVRRLAESVAVAGATVKAFGLEDAWTAEDAVGWTGVEAQACPVWPPAAAGYAPALARRLAEESGPDTVLHLHGLWKATSLAVLRVSRRQRTPRVVSPHGMLEPWALRQGRLRKELARRLYEQANLAGASCLHALSDAERRQIRAWGVKAPVAVIPNGVDLPASSDATEPPPPSAVADAIRSRTRGRRILLFLSRIHPKKGLLPLLEAWAEVASRHPDWVLVIAGPDDGGHERAVRDRIRERNLDFSVWLPGPQYGAEKEAWLRAAGAGILPSVSEGLPLAALEMLAQGVPMVLTPACHLEEAVACGAALGAEPEPSALADALNALLGSSEDHRREMGRRGRELIRRAFSWESVALRMMAVYRWVLGEGNRPPFVL